jgi:FkbM family methyltransferase
MEGFYFFHINHKRERSFRNKKFKNLIKKLLKRPILTFVERIAGKKKYQNFFIILNNLAFKGLNLRNINIYENGELRIIKQLARFYEIKKVTELVLFDVGANQGSYSELLLKEFSDFSTELHAFEPLPVPFKTLEGKINQLNKHKASAHNFGLGNDNARVKFFVDHESSELGSIFKRDLTSININMGVEAEIEIKRIEDFCSENSINHIHFMKVDVEGAEIEVFKGARSLLSTNRVDFIQFEFGSGNVDSKTYMSDFFKEIGNQYELFRILKDGIFPMKQYTGDYEILVMGNYFAISKILLQTNAKEIRQLLNF